MKRFLPQPNHPGSLMTSTRPIFVYGQPGKLASSLDMKRTNREPHMVLAVICDKEASREGRATHWWILTASSVGFGWVAWNTRGLGERQ